MSFHDLISPASYYHRQNKVWHKTVDPHNDIMIFPLHTTPHTTHKSRLPVIIIATGSLQLLQSHNGNVNRIAKERRGWMHYIGMMLSCRHLLYYTFERRLSCRYGCGELGDRGSRLPSIHPIYRTVRSLRVPVLYYTGNRVQCDAGDFVASSFFLEGVLPYVLYGTSTSKVNFQS